MNCRRCENLLPLYVEGDLTSTLAEKVSAHLEWCGKCNWLFDEYKESQGWLRSPVAPEFGDAELNAMKAGILKRVAEGHAKPSLFATLLQQWSRRQVFALSTAALIIAGLFLLYIYQTRAKVAVPVNQVAGAQPDHPKQPDQDTPAPGPETPTVADSNKRPRQPKRPYATSKRALALAQRAVEQKDSQARSAVESIRVPTVDSSAPLASSPAMLRIEIQTSDPHIRIIWFAPKETDSHQTKPATD